MASKKNVRVPALLGLCLTAALATACASDSWMGRRTAMGSSSTTGSTGAMGASGGYTTYVPSPTGASGPMDHVPNATGGTAFGTEGGGGAGN